MIEPGDRNRTAANGESDTNEPKDLTDHFETTYAPGWRPAIHEVVQGVVIELSERLGYDDKPYPIVVVRKDAGDEVALHAFHTVLRAKLEDAKPVVGDRLAIRYEGRVKSKTAGHKPYHGYSLVVEHNSGENSAAGEAPADRTDIPQ